MNEMRTDVHCTNCGRTFLAILDLALNGNHEITCPYCSHVHYRVVQDGRVTEERWRSSAGTVVITASTSTTAYVTSNLYTTASTFLAQSWLNRADLTT